MSEQSDYGSLLAVLADANNENGLDAKVSYLLNNDFVFSNTQVLTFDFLCSKQTENISNEVKVAVIKFLEIQNGSSMAAELSWVPTNISPSFLRELFRNGYFGDLWDKQGDKIKIDALLMVENATLPADLLDKLISLCAKDVSLEKIKTAYDNGFKNYTLEKLLDYFLAAENSANRQVRKDDLIRAGINNEDLFGFLEQKIVEYGWEDVKKSAWESWQNENGIVVNYSTWDLIVIARKIKEENEKENKDELEEVLKYYFEYIRDNFKTLSTRKAFDYKRDKLSFVESFIKQLKDEGYTEEFINKLCTKNWLSDKTALEELVHMTNSSVVYETNQRMIEKLNAEKKEKEWQDWLKDNKIKVNYSSPVRDLIEIAKAIKDKSDGDKKNVLNMYFAYVRSNRMNNEQFKNGFNLSEKEKAKLVQAGYEEKFIDRLTETYTKKWFDGQIPDEVSQIDIVDEIALDSSGSGAKSENDETEVIDSNLQELLKYRPGWEEWVAENNAKFYYTSIANDLIKIGGILNDTEPQAKIDVLNMYFTHCRNKFSNTESYLLHNFFSIDDSKKQQLLEAGYSDELIGKLILVCTQESFFKADDVQRDDLPDIEDEFEPDNAEPDLMKSEDVEKNKAEKKEISFWEIWQKENNFNSVYSMIDLINIAKKINSEGGNESELKGILKYYFEYISNNFETLSGQLTFGYKDGFKLSEKGIELLKSEGYTEEFINELCEKNWFSDEEALEELVQNAVETKLDDINKDSNRANSVAEINANKDEQIIEESKISGNSLLASPMISNNETGQVPNGSATSEANQQTIEELNDEEKKWQDWLKRNRVNVTYGSPISDLINIGKALENKDAKDKKEILDMYFVHAQNNCMNNPQFKNGFNPSEEEKKALEEKGKYTEEFVNELTKTYTADWFAGKKVQEVTMDNPPVPEPISQQEVPVNVSSKTNSKLRIPISKFALIISLCFVPLFAVGAILSFSILPIFIVCSVLAVASFVTTVILGKKVLFDNKKQVDLNSTAGGNAEQSQQKPPENSLEEQTHSQGRDNQGNTTDINSHKPPMSPLPPVR